MTGQQLFDLLFPAVVKTFVLGMAVIPLGVGYVVLMERKLLGWFQVRPGPNRVGPWGLLQPIADAMKLLAKEDITPARAEKVVHFLAPALIIAPALIVFSVIPYSWGPMPAAALAAQGIGSGAPNAFTTPITDVNVALLLVLSFSSIGVYGILLAGWSSNNKYSLMGGLRSAAQMVSYEIPMALAIAAALIMARSFEMGEIVMAQMNSGFWFVFPGLAAFVVYLVAGIAETNRAPFDLPEAESELVGGFHTEYSGMSFAFFFLAEYANVVVVSSIAITLFFGGWLPIFPSVKLFWLIPPFVWYAIKLFAFLFLYIWVRATFPRYRFDQLMGLGWKRLIPLALVNLVVTAAAVLIPGKIGSWPAGWALLAAVNLCLAATAVWRIFRTIPAGEAA